MKLYDHNLTDQTWSKELSAYLCEEHVREFDKWWDPDRYNWEDASTELAQYCHMHFEKWWDPEKFNWEDKNAIEALMKYCSMYFDKWWNRNKWNWKNRNVVSELVNYCYKYADIWFPEYVRINNLANVILHITDLEKLKFQCTLKY